MIDQKYKARFLKVIIHIVAAAALFMVSAGHVFAVDLIVNANNPNDLITKRKVRSIYGLHLKNWGRASTIKVYALPDNHEIHIRFCKDFLSIFPHQLRAAWDRATFSGTAQAPVIVRSVEEMIQKVSENPGAIGYIDDQEIIDENIKILVVE